METELNADDSIVAYSSLMILTVLPIVLGSMEAANNHNADTLNNGKVEKLSKKNAFCVPLYSSVAFYGLHKVLATYSMQYVTWFFTAYCFLYGLRMLTLLLRPIMRKITKAQSYQLQITGSFGRKHNFKLNFADFLSFFCALAANIWYSYSKNWILNNMMTLALATSSIKILFLNSFGNGIILLSGLLCFDVYWVFGSNVMTSAAFTLKAPVKLLFPKDLLLNGLLANQFAYLVLSDIVVPGTLIALLMRFDQRKSKAGKRIYFFVTFIAYLLGLMTSFFAMHAFEHAQPALLYIVPFCVLTPIILALLRGELRELFRYEDYPKIIAKAEKDIKITSKLNLEKIKNPRNYKASRGEGHLKRDTKLKQRNKKRLNAHRL